MKDIFNEINSLNIQEILELAWVWLKKDSWSPFMFSIIKNDWKIDNSFKVNTSLNIAVDFGWDNIKWWVFDIIWRYVLSEDTTTTSWRAITLKWFLDKWLVKKEDYDTQKEKRDILKTDEIFYKIPNLLLGGYKQEINSFLLTRWVPYDFISKNTTLIGSIFCNIWFSSDFFTTEHESWKDINDKWYNVTWDTAKFTDIFIFPCLDEQWNIIWAKLRRRDWKTIRGKKSPSLPAPARTWLLYEKNLINKKTVYIVEWEMDYIIMRLLWFGNVVWNLWWVQSNRHMIKSLLYDVDKIICLYDDDNAWDTAKRDLQAALWRQIYTITFPIRENIKGIKIKDINDLYKAWYDNKWKWEDIFKNAFPVWDLEKIQDEFPFIFLRKFLSYYDTDYNTIHDKSKVADYIWVWGKDLVRYLQEWRIKTYDDLCYLEWGKKNHYNILNENSYLKNWWQAEPILDKHIEYLINNIWWYKPANIDWIHRSILYKITHINDFTLPALVLYWTWWSWKGTFLALLASIFWQDNTLVWLWQKELESNFDTYSWWKLIVEFKEVSSWNKFEDKKILDRIKSFVWEWRIIVNSKFEKAKEVDNIARFHLSSNHSVPIQLDSKHSWNRRFTIIKTGWALDHSVTDILYNEVFPNKEKIKSYINWLFTAYPDVPELKKFNCLDNDDKRSLEDNSEWIWNLFFEWLEIRYPNITKITNKDKNVLLSLYCREIWEDIFDSRFKQTNFDNSLSHRYEKKLVSVRWTTQRWYYINKTLQELQNMSLWEKDYLAYEEIQKLEISF